MTETTNTGREEDNAYNRLDFSPISFPSDRLTIQSLRQTFPELFDQGLERAGELQPHFFPHATLRSRMDFDPGEGLLGTLIFSERLVAAYAYGRSRDWPEPEGWEGEIGLQGFKDDLTKFYMQLGLASGEHQAAEMIRDIERQAHALAQGISPSSFLR